MLEMDAYDEPDQDSDLDYEESYTKRSKRRKTSNRVSYLLFVMKTANVIVYYSDVFFVYLGS